MSTDDAGPRDKAQRKADVLARLATPVADAWVATATGDEVHLVPLTLAWFHERIVLATDTRSPTARHVVATNRARIALGETRDVVMIDAVLTDVVPAEAADEIGEAYAEQNDWDPRTAGPSYAFFVLRPDRIQAWRELPELPGRLLMRDGVWLI